jgi:hypothetical protein
VGEREPFATSLSNSTALCAADGPALLVATVGVFVVSVRGAVLGFYGEFYSSVAVDVGFGECVGMWL